MTDTNKPEAHRLDPKVQVKGDDKVETPWGLLAIEEGLSFRSEWGYHTSEATCRTPMGNAAVSLRIDGEDGDPFPRHLRVVFHGGAEVWGKAMGEPFNVDGRMTSWTAQVHVDPLSGQPLPDASVSVSLSKANAPKEERRFLGLAPSVTDEALEARIRDMALGLVRGWAEESRYARTFYGAVARIVEGQCEEEVERARRAYVRAMAFRDDAHSLAISAEYGSKEMPAPVEAEDTHAAKVVGELDNGDFKNVRQVSFDAPARVTIEFDGDVVSALATLPDGRNVVVLASVTAGGTVNASLGMGPYDA